MKYTDVFENYPIPKAVGTLALPTMLGMLVTVVYNLADTFFVGQLNDPNQVAAVLITMPVFMLLMAFGSILGIGGGTSISRSLGAGDKARVRKLSSISLYSCIGLGLLFSLTVLLLMSGVLAAAGASLYTYEYAKNYLTIIAIGAVPIILNFALGQLIWAKGAAQYSMRGMMIGTMLNIVLDPIFILFLGMGVAGAALATVLANSIAVIYYLRFLFIDEQLSVRISDFHPEKNLISDILKVGIPASLGSVLMSASQMVMNNFAGAYGDSVIAALGIVIRSTMLPILLTIGLTQGIQPLIGYTYGSGNVKRMRGVIAFTMVSGTILCLLFLAIFYCTAPWIIRVFIDDREIIDLGTGFIRVMILSFPVLAIQMTIMNAFQALGKGIPALVLSISRQGLVFLPSLILLDRFYGLSGLVYAQPVADIATTLLAVILYRKTTKHVGLSESPDLIKA